MIDDYRALPDASDRALASFSVAGSEMVEYHTGKAGGIPHLQLAALHACNDLLYLSGSQFALRSRAIRYLGQRKKSGILYEPPSQPF